MAQTLPETKLTGVNSKDTKSVIVSAMLEVHGQVRFGDGTDVGLTVTETDMVLRPSDNAQLEKLIFAGSKRRGVDRRTIHELRDKHWDGDSCYVPKLCCKCPTCWLYGFTGTTQDKDINSKSRVLYATSVSVEEAQLGVNTHSRNQVNEKTQKTAGAAGIHEEQVIVSGVHFPIHTALIHVLDWEIGMFAHALLENININRYTAASRAQGGIKFVERDGGVPLIFVDESEQGIFPLAVPKVAGWVNQWQEAEKVFDRAVSVESLKETLESQGFAVRCPTEHNNSATPDRETGEKPADAQEQGSTELTLEENKGVLTVKHGEHVLMKRYVGIKALGYLRQKQLVSKQQFMELKAQNFHKEIDQYEEAIKK